jgi:hypothetical protein
MGTEIQAKHAVPHLPVLPTVLDSVVGFAFAGAAVTTVGSLVRTHKLATAEQVGRGIGRFAVAGGVLAAMLLGMDLLTHGKIESEAHNGNDMLHSPHELRVVLTHPMQPYLAFTAEGAHNDAIDWQHAEYGPRNHVDDGVDSFRHTFASEVLTVRLMQHGMDQAAAEALTIKVGAAHEADGIDNAHPLSNVMDNDNNQFGAALAGTGRDPQTGAWLSDAQLAQRALGAVATGQVVKLSADDAALIPTDAADIPGGANLALNPGTDTGASG